MIYEMYSFDVANSNVRLKICLFVDEWNLGH